MTSAELFDYLLEHRSFKLPLESDAAAEVLRVYLVKRWSKYKRQLDDIGALPEEYKTIVCSMEKDYGNETLNFYLRATVRKQIAFTILPTQVAGVTGDHGGETPAIIGADNTVNHG